MTDQDRIDREAADWVVKWEDREREPTPKEQSRWFSWLQRSPQHVQSYFDVADIHERLGRMDPANKIDVDEWLANRRAPVVAIVPGGSAVRHQDRRGLRWTMAASLAAGIVAMTLWSFFESGSYRTAVGQQSVNRLEDGSVINLNTLSRMKVSFSAEQRIIELQGEALFTVAHDPTRPFLVRTRDATIRAVGTQFNVYQQTGETRVAVVEGVVRVSPASGESDAFRRQSTTTRESKVARPVASEGIALSAGETARVAHGRVSKDAAPDIEAEVAWQRQKLVFEDDSLTEVVAEFNRYNSAQIRVEGSIGETRRLSGTFDALHPQSLLLYLEKDPALTVQASGEDFIVRAH